MSWHGSRNGGTLGRCILSRYFVLELPLEEKPLSVISQEISLELCTQRLLFDPLQNVLIGRKERGYSSDLWLYVEYRDVKPAQRFLKSTKPKRAKTSDF